METVTITSVTAKKTGAKNGTPWTISEVTLADGRKVDSFDFFTAGETVEVEIVPNANPQYNTIMKKQRTGQQNQATFKNAEVANKAIEANHAKEARITMLSCISSAANLYAQRTVALNGGPLTVDVICETASKFYALAMNEKDTLPF